MNVSDWQRHPGYDVIVVDNAVDFYMKIFLKNLIAHSWRTKCVDPLGTIEPAGEKRCQGASQAVTGNPDFATLLIKLSDIG